MAERPYPPTEAELERALAALGTRLDFPPTPDLAAAVGARLRAAPAPAPPRRAWRGGGLGPLAAVALALVVLAGAVLALVPAARTAVADRLGLLGVTLTHLPGAPAAPLPASIRSLALGERLTVPEAQARVGFRIVTPVRLGPPDEVYVAEQPPGGQVTLVYYPRPELPALGGGEVGALLTQFQGSLVPGLVGKGLPPDTRLEQVTLHGQPAYWIGGQPHVFFYRDAQGQVRDETVRLAGNTLLWEQGGLTLRLEAALPREEMMPLGAWVR